MEQRIPAVCGVHHVKLPVRDPAVSRDFYCRVLGFEEEISFEEDGVLMGVALKDPRSGLRYAVRRDPNRAAALAGFDPIALAVTTRAELDAWVTHLDEHGIKHGPIMNGHIGWVVGFSDPDGIEVRLYTLERPDSAWPSDGGGLDPVRRQLHLTDAHPRRTVAGHFESLDAQGQYGLEQRGRWPTGSSARVGDRIQRHGGPVTAVISVSQRNVVRTRRDPPPTSLLQPGE